MSLDGEIRPPMLGDNGSDAEKTTHEDDGEVKEQSDDGKLTDFTEMELENQEQEEEEEEETYYYDEDSSSEWSSLEKIIRQKALPRLPTKSLMRFKCVSTHWNRWISSPFFINTHINLSRSFSGLFYHTPTDEPAYSAFNPDQDKLPNPNLAFLPEPVLVKASSHGLICCRGRVSLHYYISNPLTTDWTVLPDPTNDHGPDPAVVIVFDEPWVYNFVADYNLIISGKIAGFSEGIYGFETFSSKNWAWRASTEICPVERILSCSGVDAGGLAYWRTTTQSVVSYDPRTDAWRELGWPAGYRTVRWWQLVEMDHGRLCCVCVWGRTATVYVLEEGVERKWGQVKKLHSKEKLPWPLGPIPLRTEGGNEVLFWEDGLVVARDLERGNARLIGQSESSYCDDFLPYRSSLLFVKKKG